MADFVLQNEVHSKKILLHSLSTSVEVPVTAMRGRVNDASGWNVGGLVKVQKEMSQLLGIKKTAVSINTGWLKTCYS